MNADSIVHMGNNAPNRNEQAELSNCLVREAHILGAEKHKHSMCRIIYLGFSLVLPIMLAVAVNAKFVVSSQYFIPLAYYKSKQTKAPSFEFSRTGLHPKQRALPRRKKERPEIANQPKRSTTIVMAAAKLPG